MDVPVLDRSAIVTANKASFRRIPEVIYNRGELDVASDVMVEQYVEHIPLPPGYTPDRAGFVKFVAMWRTAVPDLQYTVTRLTPDDLIGEGDKVVHRVVGRGTHRGEMLGIAPTGRPLQWTETHIGRYENGMLVEHWGQIDVLRMMQCIGVVPGYTPAAPDPIPPEVADPNPLSADQMRAFMTRFIDDVWNRGQLETADEIFHPAATSPSAPQLPPGPAGVKLIAAMFRNAFPDFHMSVDNMIVEYPFIVGRFTESGTHRGELMGIAPTGKSVRFGEIGILRVANRQVVESWYEVDMLGLMGQLGVGGSST
jgi:predicted ester cyclase